MTSNTVVMTTRKMVSQWLLKSGFGPEHKPSTSMLVNLIFKEDFVHRSGVRLNFNLQFIALPLVKPVA